MANIVRARGEKTPQMHADLRAKGISLPARLEERKNVELFAGARKKSRKLAVSVDGGHAVVTGATGSDADEIRARVDGLLVWRDSALAASQHCHAMALHGAFVIQLEAMYGQTRADTAVEREASKRVIAQYKRADAWAASALALVALYQASAAGSDAAVLDKTAMVAVDQFNAPLGSATEEEVAGLFKAGREKAIQIDKWSRTWGPSGGIHDDHDRRQLLGLTDEGTADYEDDAPALDGDTQEVTHAVLGLLRADPGAILRGAAILFPKDSPVRIGLTGAGAIAQGDYVTALKSAAALAPKDSAIGGVLTTSSQILAIANTGRS
jgi:hypothetical protein